MGRTLLDVGDAAFGLLEPGFFFLILIPGTGAEFRASRKPVDSIAGQDKTIRQLEIQHLLLLERMLGLNLRCAGMILTLISLAEFDGVFKGLYFFSKGVFSNGPELIKRNKRAYLN